MSLPTTGPEHDHLAPGLGGIGSPDVIDAAGKDQIVVPGRDFIVHAEYQRVGDDLILSADGREVVVRHYFDSAHPAELASGEGAAIPGALAARLAGPIAPGQYAQAGQPQANAPVGHVETVEGPATIQHPDGTRVVAAKGTDILEGDVVQTGAGAKLGIVFVDKSTFALDSNARMVIDQMVFDPSSHQGSSTISLMQGVFLAVTGEIGQANHDAVHINTPVGSIGIRGTEFAVQIANAGGQSLFTLIGGAIEVRTPLGATLLNVPGLTTVSTGISDAPWAAFNLPPGQFGSVFAAVLALANSLAPFSADPGHPPQNPYPAEQDQQNPQQNQLPDDEGQLRDSADQGQGLQDINPGAGDNLPPATGSLLPADLSALTAIATYFGFGAFDTFHFDSAGLFTGITLTALHSPPPPPDRPPHETLPSQELAQEASAAANTWHDGEGSKTLVPQHEDDTAQVFANPTTGKTYILDGQDQLHVQDEPDVVVSLSGFKTITFHGGAGNDTLDASATLTDLVVTGGGGDDLLKGGFGNDRISGDDGNDRLFGGAGDDTLIGGIGTNRLDGGDGYDTVEYSSATASVSVSLSDGFGNAKFPSTPGSFLFDSLVNIEAVVGSSFADTITGDAHANTLSGGDGDDRLTGLGGADTLVGGPGNDTFVYTSPTDGAHVAANGPKGAQAGDTIVGFQSGADKLEFAHAPFAFASGTSVQDGVNFSTIATAYDGTNAGTNAEFTAGHASFVYSTADHTLYYDGNGAAAGYTVVAIVQSGDEIHATDVKVT